MRHLLYFHSLVIARKCHGMYVCGTKNGTGKLANNGINCGKSL